MDDQYTSQVVQTAQAVLGGVILFFMWVILFMFP